MTPEVGLSYLHTMKFRRIVDTDYVPAASLGGLTYGVSPLEMASAYAALENDGVFRTPTCIIRITDIDGKDVVENTVTKTRVYEQNAARTMTDVLKGVLTVGTARKKNLETALAAGKTGTADDRKDGWFIGYTSYYTTSVWVGCDMPKEVAGLAGSSYPLSIWKDYMDTLHEGLPVVEFEPYTPVTGTYVAPDVKNIPTPIPTPTPEPAPTEEPDEENGDAADYRVTPPPSISWGDEEDPTSDPQ